MTDDDRERIRDPKRFSIDTRRQAFESGQAANLWNDCVKACMWKEESVAGMDWRDGFDGKPFGAREDRSQ